MILDAAVECVPRECVLYREIDRDTLNRGTSSAPDSCVSQAEEKQQGHGRPQSATQTARTRAELLFDDRRHCFECQRNRDGKCQHTGFVVVDDIPRRCHGYVPMLLDPDRRTGTARWPWLAATAQ
jgi:hypothetical protein